MMKAIRQAAFGDADQLVLQEVPTPEPAPTEVLIKVMASGVHVLDTSIRAGEFGPVTLPMTPGREVAGIIVGVGSAVGRAAGAQYLGQRVVCHLGAGNSGGYAEYAATAAERVHQLPVELTFEAAIALIGSGRTALAALDLAGVTGDDIVIVPGAAGGLGNLLVQGASAFGATVIALVTGTTKAAAIADFGATVLDTDKPNWSAELSNLMAANPATVLLDGVGGPVARVAFEALGSGARVVPFGWSSGSGLSFDTQDLMSRAITVSAGLGPAIMSRPGYLRELETRALAAGAAGSIRPLVHEFALADAAEAHRAIENRRAIGKVVLRVW